MDFPKFCVECGSPLIKGSKFCANCGAKIVLPEEKEEVVEEPKVIEEQPQEVVEPVKEEVVEEPKVIEEQPKEVIEPIKEEVVEEPKVIEEQPQEVVEPVKKEAPKEPEVIQEEPKEIIEETPVVEEEPKEEAPITKPDPVKASVITATALGAYVFGVNPAIQGQEEEPEKVDDLLEPRKKYLESLEKEHSENSEQYFDELVKDSGVDVNLNKDTMREYAKLEAEKASLEKKLAKKSRGIPAVMGIAPILIGLSLGVFLIIGIFAFTGVLEQDFPWLAANLPLVFLIAGLIIALSIFLLVLNSIIKKKGKKAIEPLIAKLDARLQELENIGFEQLRALNQSFDFNVLNQIMRKTTPLIHLDDHVDMNKIETLINKYNWQCPGGRFNSTLYMKTGAILGNPFILYRGRTERMVNETYTGSLTITYTKKVTVGKTTTYVPVVQTLTASVTKPRPDYLDETYLIYGSEAAPHLSFSRSPIVSKYDKKSLEKLFKEREKYIDAYCKKHPDFTPFGNDEFEDYFDGIDRDNEVEYRLLFTPLAQRSMLDLITNEQPLGDSFSFRKSKMINKISLRGFNGLDYEGDPRVFMGFDIDRMKAKFIQMNNDFFKSMYFHFAPLMAIPLYQQYPSDEYIFRHDQEQAFSTTLCEMLSNRFYDKLFAHEACHTPLILKCEQPKVTDNSVQCLIHSYGYHSVPHTDYIPKMGGDGHMHDVPVTWYEYQQVEKTTPFAVQETYINKEQFTRLNGEEDYQEIFKGTRSEQLSFFKGYFSFIKNNDGKYNPSPLNELIKKTFSGK